MTASDHSLLPKKGSARHLLAGSPTINSETISYKDKRKVSPPTLINLLKSRKQ